MTNSTQVCRDICKSKCCKSTPPALTSEDITKIATFLNQEKPTFTQKKKDYYYVRKKENSSYCFFLSNSNECTVYSARPLDCRLFPILFKIKKHLPLYIIKWYVWYCPLTEFETIEKLVTRARKIIIDQLKKNPQIIFEYQAAMYETGGYKKKHFLYEEEISLL